ncbi:TetR/AcrR family transcriptional regulator [Williamsia herbipolensis]|uniref:TetR/AcrR family transcriptional regulator n=1 Tax=Williamsia herbipolensis TaxID=1603258 RepID=A0AAU4K501_9NOCA|nr:TetR/AcrR family transcriptional regulator [Williamsia herbipolensis]MCX6470808.1 TetR/AcrR family transcriptional regulator [Mycobacteriales bacterium]
MSAVVGNGRSEPTARDVAKAARRAEILRAAAHLMARRGYAAVRLEDIGAEVGISGPAMYRHFDGKHDLLAQLLIDVSRRLLDGGRAARAAPGAAEVLGALIDRHVDFAVSEPDLIEVQFRDLSSLDTDARHLVRRLQREYVDIWADVLVEHLEVPRDEARTRAHAVFGLINSSPRLRDVPTPRVRDLLVAMARAAAEQRS